MTRIALATRLSVFAALAGAAMSHAQPAEPKPFGPSGTPPETTLTIYSSAQPGAIPAAMYRPVPPSMQHYAGGWGGQIPGYALIKQERTINLKGGRSTISISDVAALIDPTTVSFSSLTAPANTKVVEQSFQFDLVSPQKMLERYVGKTINVDNEPLTLLSAAPGSLLFREADGRIRYQQDLSKSVLRFPGDDELVTKPTLVWDIFTQKEGEHRARISYQTEGITWWSDYNLVFTPVQGDQNKGFVDVGAWVSILNQSGTSFKDATLKLIAGDVQRAKPKGRMGDMVTRAAPMMEMDGAPAGFAQKSFFEYHLYTLGRPATIAENSTKQIELFDAASKVPCEKVLVYYGADFSPWFGMGVPMTDREIGVQSNTKVDVYLKFKNSKEHGLGVPMPAGRVRVSEMDLADKSLEFIGEDTIDHTPQGETIMIKLGTSFDVVGERSTVEYSVNERGRRIEETVQIKLRNRKKEPVTVLVRENMYRWTNWELIEKTHDFEKIDARTVHFPVKLAPDEEGIVKYKVRYTW